ncbi:unnamed protein product [Arctia plantaginis]|uniref:Uncharacterized protein n=1 Tax=Arctia plantaginis TaxID=874455 RepID=A0A8S1BGF0_ARCPL|nr:unnamed protein product [Arctia plantaginis]
MSLKLFFMLVLLDIVKAKVSIEVDVSKTGNVTLTHSGIEVNVITDDDIRQFNLKDANLKAAVSKHYKSGKPKNVYLKSPTPWGDLYKTYHWEQVSIVLSIKSVRVKNLTKNPIIVMSQDFENLSTQPVKVNTGISHTIENILTTSWSKNQEFTVSQEISYDVNLIFAKASGTTGFSYTTNWGVSEEKTKTETVGANTGMETELKPGQAVTAVLSATAGFLEIEVIHKMSLRGNLAVNFRNPFKNHHFWGPPILSVLRSGGMATEKTTIETIKFGYHVDASLKVFDKNTGLPL